MNCTAHLPFDGHTRHATVQTQDQRRAWRVSPASAWDSAVLLFRRFLCV